MTLNRLPIARLLVVTLAAVVWAGAAARGQDDGEPDVRGSGSRA